MIAAFPNNVQGQQNSFERSAQGAHERVRRHGQSCTPERFQNAGFIPRRVVPDRRDDGTIIARRQL